MKCKFCEPEQERLITTRDHCFVMIDLYPVTYLHSLIIPNRHVSSFFELTPEEVACVNNMLFFVKNRIEEADPTVKGFNIGVNVGEAAGQSIFHCHMHLIPRRAGDVEDPRGGVRGVIPSRQKYMEKV
jgi:ATP adenylyltransferase